MKRKKNQRRERVKGDHVHLVTNAVTFRVPLAVWNSRECIDTVFSIQS